jgi:hypothetical protein
MTCSKTTLIITMIWHYAEWNYTVSHFIFNYAECHRAKCRYAERHCAECRYAECHGGHNNTAYHNLI